MYKFLVWIKRVMFGADTRPMIEILKENGLKIGKDCNIMGECIIDPGHCWLIEIGNNVIIGAHCVVANNIPDNSVAVGNPARVIKSYEEYMKEKKDLLKNSVIYDESYTINHITDEKMEQMKIDLKLKSGFVI